MINQQKILEGQAIYTPQLLSLYNLIVLQFSNSYIWKCPTSLLLEKYNQWVSNNHLDVGVGTGYFLDNCQFPTNNPRIGLMDLNVNSLTYASQKIAHYQPEIYQQDVFETIIKTIEPFESISLNYLFHCLPGTFLEKEVVIKNLKTLLQEKGRVFGSTILHDGIEKNPMAKMLMNFYNSKGIFHNQGDTLEGLKTILNRHFTEVSVEVFGCVAIFVTQN